MSELEALRVETHILKLRLKAFAHEENALRTENTRLRMRLHTLVATAAPNLNWRGIP
jgi:regulator of replication initiation timing